MFRTRIRLVLLYAVILTAILSAVVLAKVSAFGTLFRLEAADIFAPLPEQILADGTVTFLLLGIGGGDHEGPNLTDSITFVRYSPEQNQISTLGIPRDLWDPDIKDKVNSIYTYALDQTETNTFAYVKSAFMSLLQTEIDYVAVIDFKDFEELIDLLGGIRVNIDKGFVDPWYPKAGYENTECEPYDPNYSCRYETLVFREGNQELNGTVALKFVRSRHAQGDEGSDFSRSKRQQLVINGIQSRLMEIVKQRDFDTILQVMAFLDSKIKRDITNKESLAIGRTMLLHGSVPKVRGSAINDTVFEVPPLEEYDGRYVLIPKDGDYAALGSLINNALNDH